jgi:UDP-N-acetylmuramoyl-L-alanyl-D-glutamate--2,6-diaminopimelate ligase
MLNANAKTILLSELISEWLTIPTNYDKPISGISLDSRKINPGDLFIALPGTKTNGAEFIINAKKHGAIAALLHSNNIGEQIFQLHGKDPDFPIIPIFQLIEKTGKIASKFYGDPSKKMNIIGVTGTSGKTSCTQFIANTLSMTGETAGVIGTLGFGLAGQLQAGELTSPDAITLQKELAELHAQGAQNIAIEASSHGLAQSRLNGVLFKIGIFTNLSRDHLDYHATMSDYAHAKHLLFEQPGLQNGIFNLDDPYGLQWALELKNKYPVYGYTLDISHVHKKTLSNIICTDKIHLNEKGFTANIFSPWGDGVLTSKLLGRFNLSNLLAVITTLGILNIPLEKILAYLAQLTSLPGRMQTLGGGNHPLVVIDYAHKPDALEKVLQTLREYCTGKLWCVFGCGGNRDGGKRPVMGNIATTYADEIILTDDNPRNESPQQIVADIISGISDPSNIIIEHDRARAIEHVIGCAKQGDVVLIAGKGHETNQIVGKEKIPFSDIMQVKICLANKDS